MHQITLLAQVIQLLPRDSFKKLVRKHGADKHSKGISSWDHLVVISHHIDPPISVDIDPSVSVHIDPGVSVDTDL